MIFRCPSVKLWFLWIGYEAVYVESSLRHMKVKKPPRKVFRYKSADYALMKEDLRAYQDDFIGQTEDSSVNHMEHLQGEAERAYR